MALIMTGGTIESVGVDRLDLAWYLENDTRLPEGELLGRVPEMSTIARVERVPFRRFTSHAMTDDDLVALVEAVHRAVASGAAGVVITQGTNTIDETAWFLHLTLKTDRPVVVAGAMRPPSAMGSDAELNLLNAVRVAASPEAAGIGVVVVLNDTIHGARDVSKTATFRVDAFDDRDLGPLGFADNDGRVVLYHRPARPHTVATPFHVRAGDDLPRVDIVVSFAGADGALVEAAAAAGAKGIVSAGTGAGYPTPGEVAALARAAERGVVICQSTRVGSGRTVRSPGLARRGWVAADNLPPWKARILLRLALARTSDPDEIQGFFDTY